MNHRPFHRLEAELHAKGYRVLPCGAARNPRGREIGRHINGNGYREISTTRGSRKVLVHRLQAFQLFGERVYAPGIVVRHLDGNPLNNSTGNLALGTDLENTMDRLPDDRRSHAKKASAAAAKFNHADVLEFYASCKSYAKTMERFGIASKGTLHFIIHSSETATQRKAA
jgi:hypothetical protein